MPYILPGANIDSNLPSQLREIGDKHAPLAWIVRNIPPDDLERLFSNWSPEDARKILFLVKTLHRLDDYMDDESLDDLTREFLRSGISGRKLKIWAEKLGGKSEKLVDAFLNYAANPDTTQS